MAAAERAFERARAEREDEGSLDRPKRIYSCPACFLWHLTKLPTWMESIE